MGTFCNIIVTVTFLLCVMLTISTEHEPESRKEGINGLKSDLWWNDAQIRNIKYSYKAGRSTCRESLAISTPFKFV